ncbi:MAG: divalent cation transporter [Sphingomonadales bacterium]|nr:divalent cation transporter [Sphingomonadales bacterium]NCO49713.1 divalent cation transporter [Sphingomonadales bacterium]NCP01006.1 divalent cation transporter [Sphingomonadales bacterium]NCP25623.1 divalent cation transporter [Sphingomonadales bacterium]NCP49100.1 divalent cation transporter [Sphingomonadales bacterium]
MTMLILLSMLAGLAAFVGAGLGCIVELKKGLISAEMHRTIIAFGGGALIGAVGLVLVPHGLESQPVWLGLGTFLAGGLVFLIIDHALKRRGTPVSQLVALNLDFIPEAIVLGAVISGDFEMALFLTAIIVAQNLPEGFNAYREIRQSHAGFLRKHVLQIMSGCIAVGPLAAMSGYWLFSLDNMILGSIMTFCAGGILYLVFEDVAPDAHRTGDWRPALGAVIGFSVALVGFGLTG